MQNYVKNISLMKDTPSDHGMKINTSHVKIYTILGEVKKAVLTLMFALRVK